MPRLDPDTPLPWRPRRILVAGSPGVGKSSMAARIVVLVSRAGGSLSKGVA